MIWKAICYLAVKQKVLGNHVQLCSLLPEYTGYDPLSTDYTTREKLKGQLILGHSVQEKELQGQTLS